MTMTMTMTYSTSQRSAAPCAVPVSARPAQSRLSSMPHARWTLGAPRVLMVAAVAAARPCPARVRERDRRAAR